MRARMRIVALVGAVMIGAPARPDSIPAHWIARGPGGGGALYAPSFHPLNPLEMYVGSDMSDSFHTLDGGWHWQMLPFGQFGGNSSLAPVVMCASNGAIHYGLSDGTAKKSLDGGRTWTALPGAAGGYYYSLFADAQNPGRVLLADAAHLYFSGNGGSSFAAVYTNGANNLHVGGAFFSGSRVFVGTGDGLLVSANGGTSFSRSAIGGIPSTDGMASFCGATQGTTTRLWCVTMNAADLYVGLGADNDTWTGVYTLDYGVAPSWTLHTNGWDAADGDFPFFVACATNDISRAYLCGGNTDSGALCVYRTTNGGAAWAGCFLSANNLNTRTGWEGWSSPYFFGWSWGGDALGFAVSPSNPDYAAVTDYGFLHLTTNGGTAWTQAYVDPSDANPTNTASDKLKFYHGAGMNETSAWWLDWTDSNTIFACFTDIRGLVSTNRGASWRVPKTLSQNTTYESLIHPTNHYLYAACSSVHDLYSWDNYCKDGNIDGGVGLLIYSTDKGLSWQTLHDFTKPVVSLAVDPRFPSRMYSAVVNYANGLGGIYVTSNLQAGIAATWGRLANPPRTEGHPYKIRVLNDGTLVAAYSARIYPASGGNFQASSGIFVSTNGGASWVDRTAANMTYYTKQFVISPFDSAQNTWLAGVWGEWGNAANKGGLYRTTNRGVSWQRVLGVDNSDPYKAVESCTLNPANSNECWITTESYGLMVSSNIWAATPSFAAVTNFPFSFGMGIFFNPYDTNEIWVTTHGGGMWVGRPREILPDITSLTVTGGATGSVQLAAHGLSGQRITTQTSTNLTAWSDTFTNWMLDDGTWMISDTITNGNDRRFYRNTLDE